MKLATPPAQLKHPEKRPGSKSSRRLLPAPLIFALLGAGVLMALLLGVSFGSTTISFATIVQIVLNGSGLTHFTAQWDPTLEVIIWRVRMPIVVGAALVGAALGVAGTLFQGLLRNPLADPFLMGTSAGAALGAAITFILPIDVLFGSLFSLTPLLAFVGALLSVLLVYSIASTGGRTPIVTLLLAGVVVNAVLVAFQTLLLTLSQRAQFGITALFNWLSGGVIVTDWPPVLIVGAIILVGSALAFSFAGSLDALALGEEGAAHLGLNVERSKFVIIIVASLVTAAAVSISGLIGFVGLVTPHMMRLLLGPRHRLLLPASALGGAIFLMLADLLARVIIAPAVLPVGSVTALVGAPFFLYLLKKNKREYTW